MKYTLCGPDKCCPTIDIRADSVIISDQGSKINLNKNSWNYLVDLIQRGELKKI